MLRSLRPAPVALAGAASRPVAGGPGHSRPRGAGRGRGASPRPCRLGAAAGRGVAGAPPPSGQGMRTCRRCKQKFDPAANTPHSCKFHPAHYGGETARKFEGAYTGGTMTTSGGGEVVAYWHCCGETDPAHPGCEAAPHVGFGDD